MCPFRRAFRRDVEELRSHWVNKRKPKQSLRATHLLKNIWKFFSKNDVGLIKHDDKRQISLKEWVLIKKELWKFQFHRPECFFVCLFSLKRRNIFLRRDNNECVQLHLWRPSVAEPDGSEQPDSMKKMAPKKHRNPNCLLWRHSR